MKYDLLNVQLLERFLVEYMHKADMYVKYV